MKEYYIRFRAGVNPQTAHQLLSTIDNIHKSGHKTVHILISTPGGSVKDGMDIYNYLKSIPIDIHTYNFGQVDSIGVIIYCGGKKRYSSPHTRFFFHPVQSVIQSPQRLDEYALQEIKNNLDIDQQNIASIVAAESSQSKEDVLKLIHDRRSLSPEEAKARGIVGEIAEFQIPADAEIIPIEQIQQVPNPQFQVAIPSGKSEIPINFSAPRFETGLELSR